MGKKKASSKPGKDETEEERMVRLEMAALAAEEKARVQSELSRVALRQKQMREQHYAHINGIKIHNQWRKIMRMAKVEELRKQVEILSQNHEREVDRKDALVQLLDRDLEEAEEQHQLALRSHLLVLDNLLDLQAARLAGLEAQFNSSLKELQDEFAAERGEITASHARQKKELQDMAEAMQAEFSNAEADARQDFESAREEVRNRNSEEYNVLKIQLEGIIEELERHFEQAHKAYLEGTEHRTAGFKSLTNSDAAAAKVIEQRMKKLMKLQEDLQHWRTKIATNGREWEERNTALRREKELMSKHYSQLKAALDASRAASAERLKQLSVMSSNTMQDLRCKIGKAESVLKLAEMCRKLETEQEKVIPFWNITAVSATAAGQQGEDGFLDKQQQQILKDLQQSGDRIGEQEGSSNLQQQQQLGETGVLGVVPAAVGSSSPPALHAVGLDEEGKLVKEWDYLNKFFKRYNKVVLDVAAVEREQSRLEQENEDLRQLLKTFLDGISVNESVLNNPANPLLVVNQRLQLVMAERRKQRTGANSKPDSRAVSAHRNAAGGSPTPVLHLQGAGLFSVPALSSHR